DAFQRAQLDGFIELALALSERSLVYGQRHLVLAQQLLEPGFEMVRTRIECRVSGNDGGEVHLELRGNRLTAQHRRGECPGKESAAGNSVDQLADTHVMSPPVVPRPCRSAGTDADLGHRIRARPAPAARAKVSVPLQWRSAMRSGTPGTAGLPACTARPSPCRSRRRRTSTARPAGLAARLSVLARERRRTAQGRSGTARRRATGAAASGSAPTLPQAPCRAAQASSRPGRETPRARH